MSTTIPCRAQDPTTCKYHGAQQRAETALRHGDPDAYMRALTDLAAAAKTTPEVIDYFADTNYDRQLDRATKNLHQRIRNTYIHRQTYQVGGTPDQVVDIEPTMARLVYQQTADLLFKNISPSLSAGAPGGNLRVNWYTADRAYTAMADDLMDRLDSDSIDPRNEVGNAQAQTALRRTYTALQNLSEILPGKGAPSIDLTRALAHLDRAYLGQTNG